MVRMTGMVVLVVALVTAPLATADYGAGERALEAGQPTEALGHWREAAEAGDERAMFALARLYRQGLGVLQDYVEAHKWFNIAASRGEAKAAAERDALAAKMTPQQVAAAQERAAGWQRDTHRVSGAPETASRSNETSATVVRAGPPPPPRAVREAQSLLRALGYRPGPADGIWGARTGKAHRAFLRDAGLPTAEMLTPEALRALRAIAKRQGGGTEAKHSAVTARASTGVNAPGVTTEPSDALHSAAQAGDIDRLKAVLDVGVDVNARDERGWTALMYAVDKRYPLLVESLLEAKADPNVRAPDGATPLFMAAAHGHSEIIQQLMQGGADITIRGPNGKTAVDVARTRYGDVETAQQTREPSAILTLLRGLTLAEEKVFGTKPFGLNWMIVTNQPCQFYKKDWQKRPGETATWSGACKDGKATGYGRTVLQGSYGQAVYEGEYREGKMHGNGTFIWSKGSRRYKGEFREGMRHGTGSYWVGNKLRYQGQWRNGKWNGFGKYWGPSGDRYKGEFRNGTFHGTGTYWDPGGGQYPGEYHNGKRKGWW